MKKLIRISLLFSFILLLSAAAEAQTRVVFSRGATSKVVTGTMYGFHSRRVFLIRVKRGQKLRVEEVGSSHPITIIEIRDPSHKDISDMDASCNSMKWVSPTKRGDYRITVQECQKADPWRGRFRIRFKVTG